MGIFVMKINVCPQKCLPMIVFIGLSLLLVMSIPAFGEEPQQEVKYETGFYYTVKKGDTLWDISQRFNDTPWQWPDLWKENEQLPNPHWIYPGERIRLYRKGDKHRYQEQTQSVPSVTPQIDASTPAVEPSPRVDFYYGRMDYVGFIRKPSVEPLGRIFSVLDNKTLISDGDVVYIGPPRSGKAADFAPGARFTIFRKLKPTEEHNSDRSIGTQHYLLGVLEVTKIEPQYAIAKVTKAFRAIKPDDLLMEYQEQSPEMAVEESTPGIVGKIIGSEEHTRLINENNIVFIDKGEDANIRKGQQYTVYFQETAKGPSGKPIKLAPVDAGSMIVLRTEKTTSTVIITESPRRISPGYLFRTP